MKETPIVKEIIDYLRSEGFMAIRINSGGVEPKYGGWYRGAPAGTSDIIACSPEGRFVAIEVKTPQRRKEVTPAQEAFLKSVLRATGVAMVACDVEEVKIKLNVRSP